MIGRKTQKVLLAVNIAAICFIVTIQLNSAWLRQYFYPRDSQLIRDIQGNRPEYIRKMMEEQEFPDEFGIVLPGKNRSRNPMLDIVGVPLRFYELSEDEIESAGWIDMYKYKPEDTLDFVPPVPKFSVTDLVYRISDEITKKHLALDKQKYENKRIVILTPIHNSEHDLVQYGQMISELDYPTNKLSLVFGEDGSTDQTLKIAKYVSEELLKQGFHRAEVLHFNITGQTSGDWNEIHDRIYQYKRRKHLAKARNLLLKGGLKDEDYALWIDSDIGSVPPDLIQQLLYADKDVVTPCCLYRAGRYSRIYDKNTWRETETSLKDQKKLSKNQLVLEGYGPTTRIYLPHLKGEGRIVPIDGVGGCSLMVKAECHRKGLKFPEKIFKLHIETEGLAKLAKSMGFSVYGLPFVEVYHK